MFTHKMNNDEPRSMIKQKGMTFDQDFGYSFPLFCSWVKVMPFCSISTFPKNFDPYIFQYFSLSKNIEPFGTNEIKTKLIALYVFKCAFSMYSNSLNIWSHQFVKCQIFHTPLLSQFLVILTFILRGGVCMETNS